jgi:hypothetical protein
MLGLRGMTDEDNGDAYREFGRLRWVVFGSRA